MNIDRKDSSKKHGHSSGAQTSPLWLLLTEFSREKVFKCSEKILEWFEKWYVGTKKTTRSKNRCAPVYSIERWSCHSRVLNNEPRTNNLVEGFNNAFSRLLSHAHPSIYKLIDAMRKYYQLATGRMVKFMGGERKKEFIDQ